MGIISDTDLAELAEKSIARCVRNGAAVQTTPGLQYRGLAESLFSTNRDPESASMSQLAQLAVALRQQRRLGRSGHWSYDLNRHLALSQAYEYETARLRTANLNQQ